MGNYHYMWTKKKPLPRGFRVKDSCTGEVGDKDMVISWRELWSFPNFDKKSRKSEIIVMPSGKIEFWQEDHEVPGKFYPLTLSVEFFYTDFVVTAEAQTTAVNKKYGGCIINTPVGVLQVS